MRGLNPKVAVIGAGYWGKNLVRNFHQLGALAWVCDERAATLAEMESKYGVKTTNDLETVLADPAVDAVVIANNPIQATRTERFIFPPMF